MLITTPILDMRPISEHNFIITISWQGRVQAGQFFMLHSPSEAHILPRPISVFDYDDNQEQLSFFIRIKGKGTELISHLKEGNTLKLFGPLGNGFPHDVTGGNVLLMGAAEGLAPMLLATKNLLYKNTVRLFAGFRHQQETSILKYFAPYQDDMEISYTCEEKDQRLISSLLENCLQPDIVYLCGSEPMMKACLKAMSAWHSTHKFVSLESHMACGLGACMGCTIKGSKGKALRPCTEGPVFNAKEVF